MSDWYRFDKDVIPCPVQSLKGSVDLRLVPPSFADPDTLVSRLHSAWGGASVCAHVADARILVLGFDSGDAAALTQMLRDAGVKSCETCKDVSRLRDVSELRGTFTHVVVNPDAFNDIDDAVSALLLFRASEKSMIVILISDALKQDDLFPDRKCICDASLRAPVSFNRLCDGLLAAWVNNRASIC